MKEKIFSVTMADCDLQTFHAGGKGGQNQNKRNTGVRVKHKASGATGEARDERSQLQNKKLAFERMVKSSKFQIWLNKELWIRSGFKTPEQLVEETMIPENLKIEYRENGTWTEVD